MLRRAIGSTFGGIAFSWYRLKSLEGTPKDQGVIVLLHHGTGSPSSPHAAKTDDVLRAVFDNTYQFIGLLDPHGTVLEVNQTALTFAGVTLEQVVGCAAWETPWVPPKARSGVRKAVRRAAGGAFVHEELEIMGATGQLVPIDFSLRPTLDAQNQVSWLIAEGHDITAQKRVERALERQQAFLQAVLETSSDGIVACDAEGTLTLFNPAARRFHGVDEPPEPPLPALEWPAVYHLYRADGASALEPEEVPLYRALTGEGVRHEEIVIAPPGGTRRRVLCHASALTGARGKALGAVVAMRDVTDARAAEAALYESEANLRAVVSALSEGVIQQGADGRVSLCNAAAERILGLTKAQLLQEDSLDPRWRAVYEDGSPFPGQGHPAMTALRTGVPQEGVVMGVHKPGGSLTWVLVNAEPLWRLGEKAPYAVVSSFIDITHLKQTEAQLRYASLHDSLTGLALRGPLIERLEGAVARAKREPNFHFAVLYIDLDGFKAVNDTLGHGVGDNLLVAAARRLEGCVRESDMVVRLGGDEFVVLLEGLAHSGEATQLAERVVRDLNIAAEVGSSRVTISASIGVVLSSQQLNARDLLHAADTAMYQAKTVGKASYRIFGD